MRDVEELASIGLPVWARWIRIRGATKTRPGTIDEPVEVGGGTIEPGDAVVLDADGVAVVPRARVDEVLAASRTRAEKERDKRAALEAGALSYDLDGLRALVEALMATPPDLAHIHHAELLSTTPEESLRFFVDVLGMEIEAQDGPFGLPARLGRLRALQPQADRGGSDRASRTWRFRAWNQEALDRVARAIEATGRGQGWIDGDHGHGPAYRFTDPDGHVFELLYEADRYDAAARARAVAEEPAAALHRPRRRREAARPRQPARRGRARRRGSSRRTSSGTGSTSASSSTTGPRREPG